MIKVYILMIFVVSAWTMNVVAQQPVKWNYSVKKIGNKNYEVHFTAIVESPWHIYSQNTPEGGPVPTKLSFTKNPIIVIEGVSNEVGKLHTKHEDVFNVDVKYYDGTVDFVQKVKLKSNAKTNITGKIEYMVCNDQQCLPPTKTTFNIKID